jgi:hypothetical protein
LEFTKIIEKVAAISLTSSNVLRTGFPTGGMPCPRGLSPRLLICEIEPHFSFRFEPASSPWKGADRLDHVVITRQRSHCNAS